jgi:hypothetical protein
LSATGVEEFIKKKEGKRLHSSQKVAINSSWQLSMKAKKQAGSWSFEVLKKKEGKRLRSSQKVASNRVSNYR